LFAVLSSTRYEYEEEVRGGSTRRKYEEEAQ
jgi:hypothetical protein